MYTNIAAPHVVNTQSSLHYTSCTQTVLLTAINDEKHHNWEGKRDSQHTYIWMKRIHIRTCRYRYNACCCSNTNMLMEWNNTTDRFSKTKYAEEKALGGWDGLGQHENCPLTHLQFFLILRDFTFQCPLFLWKEMAHMSNYHVCAWQKPSTILSTHSNPNMPSVLSRDPLK